VPVIKRMIDLELPGKTFDYIFTHGSKGEYGHPRHIGVHLAVTELVQKKKLTCQQFYYFAYKANARKRIFNDSGARVATSLTTTQLIVKRDIIKNLYGFSPRSFENMSCLARETFTVSSTGNL